MCVICASVSAKLAVVRDYPSDFSLCLVLESEILRSLLTHAFLLFVYLLACRGPMYTQTHTTCIMIHAMCLRSDSVLCVYIRFVLGTRVALIKVRALEFARLLCI